MKALHFAAIFPSWAAPAISRQVHKSLNPYARYLRSAIAAATSRRERSECRWEAVEPERVITLRALDSLIIPISPISNEIVYRIRGCPPPTEVFPIFVGDKTTRPLRMQPKPDGALVWLDQSFPDEAEIYWMGYPCRAERVPAPLPADIEARRGDGSSAPLRGRYERDGRLHLVIEGEPPARLVSGQGEVLRYEKLDPETGATLLRGQDDEVSWNGERRLSSERLPRDHILLADNGVRWQQVPEVRQRQRREGHWIQLLATDEIDGDDLVDPRAAYCEDGVNAVSVVNTKAQIRVYSSRRDSYRLELESLPPPDSRLVVPANTLNLQRQRQAVFRLRDAPLPHHRGLLRLCEALEFAAPSWPRVEPEPVENWSFLSRIDLDGTSEQREFVEKALGTPDFACLEGPPGSGKTHAICELILQSVRRGERVLVCSTTHVAVDNVLERFVDGYPEVEAVRIGRTERVDPRVQACQIDGRIAALLAAWEGTSAFAGVTGTQRERMAENMVLAAANLTCATTTGVLAHPYLRRESTRTAPSGRYFDLLILDEASKTTFQEFLVPAQLARRWVIVGDVRQLPPFTEPRDLEASFADIANDKGDRFPAAHQRACLILFRLSRREAGAGIARWLIEEPEPVVTALMKEVEARAARGDSVPNVLRIAAEPSSDRDVGVADILSGVVATLRLHGAEVIIGTSEDMDRVRRLLPPGVLSLNEPGQEASAVAYRTVRFLRRTRRLQRPILDGRREYATLADLAEAQRIFLREESWARQVAWRLGRIHQLASARNQRDRENRRRDIERLMPAAPAYAAWVKSGVDAIADVGVRSVIEALRVRRDNQPDEASALSSAVPDAIWQERAVLLTRQHRMNPDISALPRRIFYNDEALRDANTIAQRDDELGWSFLTDKAPGRRIWMNVRGREERGQNPEEVDAMREVLAEWVGYAEHVPRPDGKPWEVACLCFYTRQEIAIRDMLRGVSGQHRAETRFQLPRSTVVCGTVDRFQGREADLVFISLRNTFRTGYMDSPNRLNVALTRARQLLIIIGNHSYFSRCNSDELAAVALDTPVVSQGFWR
jgi:hypothetical protein